MRHNQSTKHTSLSPLLIWIILLKLSLYLTVFHGMLLSSASMVPLNVSKPLKHKCSTGKQVLSNAWYIKVYYVNLDKNTMYIEFACSISRSALIIRGTIFLQYPLSNWRCLGTNRNSSEHTLTSFYYIHHSRVYEII